MHKLDVVCFRSSRNFLSERQDVFFWKHLGRTSMQQDEREGTVSTKRAAKVVVS